MEQLGGDSNSEPKASQVELDIGKVLVNSYVCIQQHVLTFLLRTCLSLFNCCIFLQTELREQWLIKGYDCTKKYYTVNSEFW